MAAVSGLLLHLVPHRGQCQLQEGWSSGTSQYQDCSKASGSSLLRWEKGILLGSGPVDALVLAKSASISTLELSKVRIEDEMNHE